MSYQIETWDGLNQHRRSAFIICGAFRAKCTEMRKEAFAVRFKTHRKRSWLNPSQVPYPYFSLPSFPCRISMISYNNVQTVIPNGHPPLSLSLARPYFLPSLNPQSKQSADRQEAVAARRRRRRWMPEEQSQDRATTQPVSW